MLIEVLAFGARFRTSGNPLFLEEVYVAPGSIYLLTVNNRITRTRCKISSKLTITTPERRQ